MEASESVEYKQEGESAEQQLPIQRSKRVKKKEVSALDVIEDSKLGSSQLTIQADFGTPATPRKRGRPRKINPPEDVESKAVTEAGSLKKREGLSIQRRATRNTPAKSENTDVGKPTLEESVFMPNEELAAVMSSKKKLTKRTQNRSQKRSLRSIPEKCIDEEEMAHKEPDDQEEKLLATVALTRSSHSTRTRSSKAILLPDLSEPKNESFLFSPPVSKIPRKEKAKKIEAPAQLQELVSDLPSQFVSSPPALRTRRKNPLNTSKRTDGLEDDGQSAETVGKQQVKRIRTAKTKQASKNTEKESWSPPPVEIKLISPLASPVDGVKSKPRKTAEVTGKTVGRSRKKLSSFPKQVLRRKML